MKKILANTVYSDSTLKRWNKENLIELIRILENNWANAENSLNVQAKNCEMLLKEKQEEIESLKSKSSLKDSWKNKFFKAQEEVERLNQGYNMLNYESARKEEYIETLKKQVDELKNAYNDLLDTCRNCDTTQAVKDTAKEILLLSKDTPTYCDFVKAVKEKYSVEI